MEKNEDRIEAYEERKDKLNRRRLRDPLDVIAERLKNKDAPGSLYKSTTENRLFFSRGRIFKINNRVLADENDTYYYWLKENDEKIIKGQFYRQELFGIKDQFI